MGATLFIREIGEISDTVSPTSATWMPSAGAFDLVLEHIAAELKGVDGPAVPISDHEEAPLADVLLQVVASGDPCYDLSDFSQDTFRLFQRAAESAYNHAQAENLHSDTKPNEYLMYKFSLLKALLRTDPRSVSYPSDSGTVAINDQATWQATGWVYDFVLEHLAATVEAEDLPLATDLFASRTIAGSGCCDLHALSAPRFHALLAPVKYMVIRYGDGLERDAVAPEVLAALAPSVVELSVLLHSDPRSRSEG